MGAGPGVPQPEGFDVKGFQATMMIWQPLRGEDNPNLSKRKEIRNAEKKKKSFE